MEGSSAVWATVRVVAALVVPSVVAGMAGMAVETQAVQTEVVGTQEASILPRSTPPHQKCSDSTLETPCSQAPASQGRLCAL